MKNYQTFESIEKDLTRLKLERSIALEEMRLLKNEFKQDLKPANWVSTAFNVAGKYGAYRLLKRFFK